MLRQFLNMSIVSTCCAFTPLLLAHSKCGAIARLPRNGFHSPPEACIQWDTLANHQYVYADLTQGMPKHQVTTNRGKGASKESSNFWHESYRWHQYDRPNNPLAYVFARVRVSEYACEFLWMMKHGIHVRCAWVWGLRSRSWSYRRPRIHTRNIYVERCLCDYVRKQEQANDCMWHNFFLYTSRTPHGSDRPKMRLIK